MIDIIHTILSIDPSAQVVVREGMDIEWHDGNPNGITAEQITAKQAELVIQAETDAADEANRLASVKEKLEALGLTTEEVKTAFGI